MQQPTPRPPPHGCVVASAHVPFWHDDGVSATQAPPFASHAVAGAGLQSKPRTQPLSSVRGSTTPSGQKPGAGGDRTGHAMQQPTPIPPPHACVLASAKKPSSHAAGERPTHVPPLASHCVAGGGGGGGSGSHEGFGAAWISESAAPVSSAGSALDEQPVATAKVKKNQKEDRVMPLDWPEPARPVSK